MDWRRTASAVGVFGLGAAACYWLGVDGATSRWVGAVLALAWMGRRR